MGIQTYKFTSPGRAGVPDRMFIAPDGVVFFIEFKTPTGKLSKLQENEIKILHNRSVDAWVVDDVIEGNRIIDSYVTINQGRTGE